MPASHFIPPTADRYALRHATVPACLVDSPTLAASADSEGLCRADLLVDHGRIAAVQPAGTLDDALGPDLDRSMVLPGLVDCHTHLDKGHIWPRKQNPTGDTPGAVRATLEDRTARWSATDVRARMEFGLRTAYAHGVVAIRTHLDSQAPQASISFRVFQEMRRAWAGRITLQASSIAPIDIFLTEEGRILADIVAEAGGNLGCVTRFSHRANVPTPPELDVALRHLFALAAERGLDVDLHVDETGEPEIRTLDQVARIARREGFSGRILCGHCCSLAVQPEADMLATLDACRDAGIAIVSLPTVNMYLQDRHAARTPRWRGVTVLHEIKARGLQVAVAGDNCRDPFHAYGDHDMLDTFCQAVKIAHLDRPVGDWIAAACAVPADIMGLDGVGRLREGQSADLILLRARDYSELLARNQGDRCVLRNGRAIDTTPPDYRVLDALMTA
ncbi:cytosine deaminase [Xylophilus sp. GOD-11R]|uniref:cytosine deaminase n=1 Tax=Xylophilus sp. GOD-11R TaxID=3089814 RepID=UPI00298C53DC|nr:cytosine deaminase [Xylophilus sp. GOD-11R]WPB56266.1 cytosine deaminase [Xylophilus sp. GOD-11R]